MAKNKNLAEVKIWLCYTTINYVRAVIVYLRWCYKTVIWGIFEECRLQLSIWDVDMVAIIQMPTVAWVHSDTHGRLQEADTPPHSTGVNLALAGARLGGWGGGGSLDVTE